MVEVFEVSPHHVGPSWTRQGVQEPDESRPHSPSDLNRAGAELSDLVERERRIVLTWGASGQGGDSFTRPPAHLIGSVRLFGLCQRRSIFCRWQSEWRIGQHPIDQVHIYISVSRSGAQLPDAARFRARSTSHPVAAQDGCTNIPLTAGRGSGERNHSSNRHFSPWTTSVRTPGSARTDQVLGDLRIC